MARGQKVYCNIGMGEFHLEMDKNSVQCPVCRSRVQPVTCGFNNCLWGFVGMFKEDDAEKDKTATASFIRKELRDQVAGDAYTRFSETDNQTVSYSSLKIFTRPVGTTLRKPVGDNDCPICMMPFEGGHKELGCQHKFHANCIDKWFEMDSDRTCPYCRVPDTLVRRVD